MNPPRPPRLKRGDRFGALTVERYAYYAGGHWWSCRCECGGAHKANEENLLRGSVLSCGCARRGVRPVRRLRVSDPAGRIYDGLKAAADAHGVTDGAVSNWLKRDRGRDGGWRYLEPESAP